MRIQVNVFYRRFRSRRSIVAEIILPEVNLVSIWVFKRGQLAILHFLDLASVNPLRSFVDTTLYLAFSAEFTLELLNCVEP